MYINYANAPQDKPEGNMNKNEPIIINSCGTYKLDTRPVLPTCRPHGRIDYQLIYIASGRGYFYFSEGSPTMIEAGNMVLYQPGEYQKYVYYGKDHPSIYWIHFTGSDVNKTFSKFGITPSDKVIATGIHPGFSQAFDKIISELQLQKEFYEEAASLILVQLIMMAGRYKNEANIYNENMPTAEIDLSRAYFHEHYQENINVEAYIESKGMSTSSFFRKFKKYTGMSPLQYILEIRLTNAKKLLETTNYSINEIASIVGYENALYFSRLFRKHIGMSPREYRNSAQSS